MCVWLGESFCVCAVSTALISMSYFCIIVLFCIKNISMYCGIEFEILWHCDMSGTYKCKCDFHRGFNIFVTMHHKHHLTVCVLFYVSFCDTNVFLCFPLYLFRMVLCVCIIVVPVSGQHGVYDESYRCSRYPTVHMLTWTDPFMWKCRCTCMISVHHWVCVFVYKYFVCVVELTFSTYTHVRVHVTIFKLAYMCRAISVCSCGFMRVCVGIILMCVGIILMCDGIIHPDVCALRVFLEYSMHAFGGCVCHVRTAGTDTAPCGIHGESAWYWCSVCTASHVGVGAHGPWAEADGIRNQCVETRKQRHVCWWVCVILFAYLLWSMHTYLCSYLWSLYTFGKIHGLSIVHTHFVCGPWLV